MNSDGETGSHEILQDIATQHEEQPGEVLPAEQPAKTQTAEMQTAEMQADDRAEKKVNSEG